jgi:membrane-bound inhibitor of C-type lysozyme
MVRAVAIIFLGLLALPAQADAPMRALSGSLLILERIALPPDAELAIDVRAPDGTPLAIGRSLTEGRQSPLPFRIWMPAGRAGVLTAEIAFAGSLWRAGPIEIPAGAEETQLGEIRMQRRDGPAAPAPAPAPEAAPAPEEADEPATMDVAPSRFLCGDDVIEVAIDDGAATITVGGIDVAMQAVPAASGARFEARGDPDTFFWSHGDRALISLAGIELPECEALAAAD